MPAQRREAAPEAQGLFHRSLSQKARPRMPIGRINCPACPPLQKSTPSEGSSRGYRAAWNSWTRGQPFPFLGVRKTSRPATPNPPGSRREERSPSLLAGRCDKHPCQDSRGSSSEEACGTSRRFPSSVGRAFRRRKRREVEKPRGETRWVVSLSLVV
jgi:hypothetical protein